MCWVITCVQVVNGETCKVTAGRQRNGKVQVTVNGVRVVRWAAVNVIKINNGSTAGKTVNGNVERKRCGVLVAG